MDKLGHILSQYWNTIQGTLFPWLEEELDPLTQKQQQLIAILEMIQIERFITSTCGFEGRPRKTRAAIARSYVAKMVFNMSTTAILLDRLQSDKNLRRICGWENSRHIPSEATFSRAFAEFAEMKLPQKVHEALIAKTYGETKAIILHTMRDSTAIEGREKYRALSTEKSQEVQHVKKRGRPKKAEVRPLKEPTRIEKQQTMSLQEMVDELPKSCDIGTKKNSKGHSEHWIGYKLHIDTADGGIPISAILTSASVHDSQVAIPLASLSATRVINLYDLMDAAYDVPAILDHSRSIGHIPIVEINPRRNRELALEIAAENKRQKQINWQRPEKVRYKERTTAERVHSRLKDDFGGRMVRVRGHAKVACHLMFGLLALAADQLIKLVT